ncbi:MAG TPA: NAD(P)H-dependent glycerol-3-phosphate dehydrogenase [Nitrosomonas sp.]|nr:NAD(P)H-dependent glycerol-3-phosphate dehydrogenase [Nitrosomonas sp.]
MKLAILGAGAWGTALAINFSASHPVTLWTRNTDQKAEIERQRVNQRYLPGVALPDTLKLTCELNAAIEAVDLALVTIPIAGLRQLLEQLYKLNKSLPIILCCKGFESPSTRLPHEIVQEVYAGEGSYAILSGPSFAKEVAQQRPTALTLASKDHTFLKTISSQIRTPYLRIYASTDIIGVETGGATKNVIAIAAGISDGLELGSNARAALITRGLAEITRLGVSLGGHKETFMGLAGLGDLILTCTGNLSRNRQVGLRLAAGMQLADILQDIGHVAEGVHTVQAVLTKGKLHKIEMPITQAVFSVLYEGVSAKEAVRKILEREPKMEVE